MGRRPTIIDVAKLAEVSKATAARVLNGNAELVKQGTRDRVMDAAEKLGYERNAVAGSLRTDHTHVVALSIPDITNPFWPGVARGVQDTIEAAGYATMTVNTDWNAEREQDYLRLVRRNRFDGLIINPAMVSNDDLKRLHIPVVVLGGGENHPDFDSVGSATEQAVQELLAYLLELGHHRIGLIAGTGRRRKEHTRYQSYLTFHARQHLPLDESLVIETEFSDQAGYDAMIEMLQLQNPPTAVFAANDILALGAMKAASALGWNVPNDISIVGMDDIYAASMTSPSLTTVSKPKYEIGQWAAQLLLDRLHKKLQGASQHIKLPCQLMKRGTTAPPRR
jgi:LacI family transcriptional regulator